MTKNIKLSELIVNNGQINGLPKNPRFIRDYKFKKLVKSIQDDPEMLALRELIVYPHQGKYVVVCGNMRFRAMLELGYKEAVCKVLPADVPVDKLRAYVIKDNVSFGEEDWDSLANEWDAAELSTWGMDIPEAKDKFNDVTQEDIEYSDRVYALKNNAIFKSSTRWGLPDLIPDMIFELPDAKIQTLVSGTVLDKDSLSFLVYGQGVPAGADYSRAIMSFYCRDYLFEPVWDKINEKTQAFLNRKLMAIITPNYTLHKDEPAAVRLYSTFKSRWMGRYWQGAGIKIIPDIEFSYDKDLSDLQFIFDGIPVGLPTIAMQNHTGFYEHEIDMMIDAYTIIFDKLNPEKVLIYGDKFKSLLLDKFSKQKFCFIKTQNQQLKINKKGGERQ